MATKKRKKKKALKSLLSLAIVIILGLITYFTEPWRYIDPDQGNTGDVSQAVEVDESQMAVYYIDVGQADSILIKMPTGENVLIDAGCENGAKKEDIEKYIQFIKDQGVETINYMFLTHPHYDHIGAADDVILSDIKIENIILPESDPLLWNNSESARILDAIDTKNYTYDTCEPGTIYNIGEAVCTVLGPIGTDFSDKNDYSIVMRVVYGETEFLFTGDATTKSENSIVEEWGASALSSDVLKVGHHGSNGSSGKKFLEAVSPSLAIISVGKNNSYGHPGDKAMERIESYTNAEVLRTDKLGTIIILSDGKTISKVVSVFSAAE